MYIFTECNGMSLRIQQTNWLNEFAWTRSTPKCYAIQNDCTVNNVICGFSEHTKQMLEQHKRAQTSKDHQIWPDHASNTTVINEICQCASATDTAKTVFLFFSDSFEWRYSFDKWFIKWNSHRLMSFMQNTDLDFAAQRNGKFHLKVSFSVHFALEL